MPTPRKGYYLNGKRLPTVTTICSRLQDGDGLLYAAVKLAQGGLDYKKEWGWSAKVGTATHFLAECTLNGDDPPTREAIAEHIGVKAIPDDKWANIRTAFQAFKRWNHQMAYTKPKQEISLMSETHRFGGTFDCLYETDKGYILCDWKTSKKTTVDHMLQMAAYGILVEENFGKVVGYNLLRLDKETADFHQHHWSELNRCKDIFTRMVAIYTDLKLEEKRVA